MWFCVVVLVLICRCCISIVGSALRQFWSRVCDIPKQHISSNTGLPSDWCLVTSTQQWLEQLAYFSFCSFRYLPLWTGFFYYFFTHHIVTTSITSQGRWRHPLLPVLCFLIKFTVCLRGACFFLIKRAHLKLLVITDKSQAKLSSASCL